MTASGRHDQLPLLALIDYVKSLDLPIEIVSMGAAASRGRLMASVYAQGAQEKASARCLSSMGSTLDIADGRVRGAGRPVGLR